MGSAFLYHMSLHVRISMGPHSAQPPISLQHTGPLSPMELAATCSPCLKSHFTTLGTLRGIKSANVSGDVQHLCPSGQQLQAMPREPGTHQVPRELAHRSPVLSTCIEGESRRKCTESEGKLCMCERKEGTAGQGWGQASGEGKEPHQGPRKGCGSWLTPNLLCVSP